VLLDRHDETTAGWLYARVRLEFRTWGDSDRARETLESAFRSNEVLPECLIALRQDPDELPDSFVQVTAEEAMVVLHDLGEA